MKKLKKSQLCNWLHFFLQCNNKPARTGFRGAYTLLQGYLELNTAL